MTREELIDFLSESLTIKIEKEYDFYDNKNPTITVKLMLEDEMISMDTF